MKKNNLLILFLSIIVLGLPHVQAVALPDNVMEKRTNTNRNLDLTVPELNRNGSGTDVEYATLKNQLVRMLELAITKLDQAIGQINALPSISSTTREVLVQSLTQVKTQLTVYKDEVSETTTLQDLQSLNQDAVQYLQENKDIIKRNIQAAVTTIAGEVAQSAEKYKALIEQALKIMKVTCPAQKETISTVEDQLAELEEQITTLQTDAKSKDTAALKQDIQALAATAQELYDNLTLIQQNCL